MLRRKRAGDLCTPRFAVGHGDPILGLPRRTRFEPILAMHNFRPYTIPLEIKVGFRAAAGPQELTIPYALPARQTEVVSLHPYLQGVIPADVSWASLEISYTSTTRGFAAAMVSVSQDGEHSIRSVLNWVETGTREGWYWRADREHNTLLGIFNGAETDAVVRVSLDYYAGDTRGSYELPDIAIPARASHLLDIGEVVSSGIPDADGDVIPPGVTFGGYRVRRLGPPVQAGVTTEALIFNHRRKQFLTLYNTGCCQTPASFFPSGNQSGIIGGSLPISITTGDDCTGEPIWDMIAEGYFYFVDSSDSSVANEGSPGWLQFLGVGTTTLTYQVLHPKNWPMGGCRNQPSWGSCNLTVKPAISGPSTVWYFGGQSPSGYATQIGLSSVGGHSGAWEITQGADRASLSSSSGSQTTVSSTGTAFSSAPGDIKVRITVNGVASDQFLITSRTPHRLVPGPITTACDSTWGYLTRIQYTIRDQLETILPAGVPVNEKWTTRVINDYSGTNWRRGPEGGVSLPEPVFDDVIGGENLELTLIPVPGCAGNSTAVQHWGQEWRVGSEAIGVGRRVQTNTLQKYKDYASHLNMFSPNP